MNFFHQKMQICPQEVYLYFQAALQWDWMALGKISALNSCAGDGFIIMGEDNTGKDLFITVPNSHTPKIRMLSFFEAVRHSAHSNAAQWRQHWENLRLHQVRQTNTASPSSYYAFKTGK